VPGRERCDRHEGDILRDVYEKRRPLLNPPVVPAKELGFHTLIGLKKPPESQKKNGL
jgi:hypothetical protein